ncbi:ATP-binding cassette domain-containing protein [Nocardioides sp. MAH-18]|uniref:ATP-binding cassette domain-containing protein n=1 Tax=Nocardioides agri TaxID=2682843 RepID=A0A6L6XTF3_9ACTN|nr:MULTISPECIES: multiple monosaccharide ABC transporter ATP-binding protein [unclassified Nocardioides]MBA2955438.1 sugar ABC transporter ATP-binding protein [Nocardioides sp. CGMCC 1.13656]MVQ50288.1 ATP-binding cassette domain-containing protein [Nocardioides sp. MAH-18]
MTGPILEMRSITKRFPGVLALSDVNLTVRRGDIHAICGENGAGKSTLMKVLSGVYPHGSYDGEVWFDGSVVEFGNLRQSEASGIVIIHQELALIPELSIAENIFLGNETAKRGVINWDAAHHRAIELMARVGLAENPLTKVKDLGIGKQQLVEIAKALGKDVRLLILDEPTAALNDDDSAHLLDLLRGLKGKGITSIMISHKLNEIEQVADAITILRDGRTIETLDVAVGAVDQDRIIRGMVGRDLEHRFPDHTPEIGDVLLEVSNWSVSHPTDHSRDVIRSVDLTVRHGEIVGIAGLMGAGRTELARSIFGRSYGGRFEGELRLDGKQVELRSVHAAIGAGIAYLSEDRKGLGLNLLDDIKTSITSAGLGKLRRGLTVDEDQEVVVAERFRKDLNIKAPSTSVGVGKLSGGNQQKVVLSKWMFTDPQVLILDEPTRGIDVGAKYEIYGIIQGLAKQGKGVLVISSELPELIGLCDRIYTLAEGQITQELARGEFTQERLMKHMTADVRQA